MEDLVAVELTSSDGHVCFFITWSRIQSPVDPEPLEKLIVNVASHFAIGASAVKARVCGSLQDARDAPYFYEALFGFTQRPIPYGPDYQKWRRRTNLRMRKGKEIYFVGPFGAPSDKSAGAIAYGTDRFD